MTMMVGSNNNNNNVVINGDTTLTKVFVGGLAWETAKDTLREHFEKYGEILEAVIISDKLTGRSKGYGFVTFKEAEAAKKACEEPTVMINGRRANCNLASLGARRPKSPPQQHTVLTQGLGTRNGNQLQQQVQWYYPVVGTPPFPPHHPFPNNFYGYTPTYIATDINYDYNYNYINQKGMSAYNGSGGGYVVNGQVSTQYVYPSQQQQGIVGGGTGNTLMMPLPVPVVYHPLYPFHRTAQTMGVPAPPHIFPPTSITPPPTGPVGTGECFKRVVDLSLRGA